MKKTIIAVACLASANFASAQFVGLYDGNQVYGTATANILAGLGNTAGGEAFTGTAVNSWTSVFSDGTNNYGYRQSDGLIRSYANTNTGLTFDPTSVDTAGTAGLWKNVYSDGTLYYAQGDTDIDIFSFSSVADLATNTNSTLVSDNPNGGNSWDVIAHDGTQFVAWRESDGLLRTYNTPVLNGPTALTNSVNTALPTGVVGLLGTTQVIPEPSSALLLGLGGLGFLARRKRA